jgi:hypothetical protein
MALIKNAMGEKDSGRFCEAAAFGENIAKGETGLGAHLRNIICSLGHQPKQVSKGHQQARSSY